MPPLPTYPIGANAIRIGRSNREPRSAIASRIARAAGACSCPT